MNKRAKEGRDFARFIWLVAILICGAIIWGIYQYQIGLN